MRLRRNIVIDVVHELCEILIEQGVATNSEEVLAFIQTAQIDVLEGLVELAEKRRKRRKKLLESSGAYEYVYAG